MELLLVLLDFLLDVLLVVLNVNELIAHLRHDYSAPDRGC